MKFFRKSKEAKSFCCESCTTQNVETKKPSIKILGSGCAKCMELEKATKTAVSQLQLDCDIEHVTDFTQIACYGVMSTPALVVNEKVVSYGKVLTIKEIQALLKKVL